MVQFIEAHRDAYGVEPPICAVLPIAPSLYYELWAPGSEIPLGALAARGEMKC